MMAAGAAARTLRGAQKQQAAAKPLIGVQLGAHSVFDEGVDRCLDNLQSTAGVNAVFVYSHTYQGYSQGRQISQIAADHGVPPKDPGSRRFPMVWVQPHEEFYKDTFLRHAKPESNVEFAGKDVFRELEEPCRKRGIQLFARVLEGHKRHPLQAIPGWSRIGAIDAFGKRMALPCWNHPAYRAWWLGTIEDLFKSYPAVAGLKWGSERTGPLSSLLTPSNYNEPASICFCEHCLAEGRKRGILVDKARDGMRTVEEFASAMRAGAPSPPDGVYITLLRTLVRYPEVLAWEQMWHDSRERIKQDIYGTVKQIRPGASVGWHIDHAIAWDPLYRAMNDYAAMAKHSDWIKPVVYHEVAGPRFQSQAMDALTKGIAREVPATALLSAMYGILGYDAAKEPGWEDLTKRGFSSDYVFRETKRCVAAVAGACKVYPGVGFDVPNQAAPSTPESVYEATVRAFDAGADGLIISREYDEMRLSNLRAVGRAIRERRT
jgi:hypothetical protein